MVKFELFDSSGNCNKALRSRIITNFLTKFLFEKKCLPVINIFMFIMNPSQ